MTNYFPFRLFRKLRTQFVAMVSIGIILISTSFYFYSLHNQRELFTEGFSQSTLSTFETVRLGLTIGLSQENFETVTTVFNWAKENKSVRCIVLTDSAGESFAQYPDSIPFSVPQLLQRSLLISFQDSFLVRAGQWNSPLGNGYLYIGFSTEQIHLREKQTLREVSITTLVLLSAGIIVVFLLASNITKPLERLRLTVERIAKGENASRANTTRGTEEITTLALSFNQMLEQLLQAQRELHQRVQELDEANKLKNRLLSIASHDLRGPLGNILNCSELIQESLRDGSDVTEVLQMIDKTASDMLLLVKDLLDTAVLEMDKLQLNVVSINFNMLAASVIDQLRWLADKKNQKIHFEQKSKECFLQGDEARLFQVIENLLNNAVKYSPLHTTIFVVVLKQKNSIRLEVKDEGPGLNKEDKTKIFGQFQKLSAQPTGDEPSSGIGLSIVKQIVELHKGKVWAESEFGNSTTFIVELPRS